MFNKINVFIIGFFSILTIKYNIGFLLYIPLIVFYFLKDLNNIYFFCTGSMVSLFFTKTEIHNFIYVMCASLCLAIILNKIKTNYKNKSILYISIYIMIISIILNVMLNKQGMFISFLSSLLSVLLFLVLFKLLSNTILKNNKYGILLELIVYLITFYGSLQLNIDTYNIGLYVGLLYTIILSKKYRNIYSFIYSMICFLLLHICTPNNIEYLLPTTSTIYLLPLNYAYFAYMIFLSGLLLINSTYTIQLLIVMLLTVVLEIVNIFIKYDNAEVSYHFLKEQIYNQFYNEIDFVNNFFNVFSDTFKNPKEYNERLSNDIKILIDKNCNNCRKRNLCYNTFKEKLYEYFKKILYKEKFSDSEILFEENCIKINELYNTALQINSDYTIQDNTNNSLSSQIKGVSNVIKNLKNEIKIRQEIDLKLIYEIKQKLLMYGLPIRTFEVVRNNIDNFLINIDINSNKNIEDILKIVFESTLCLKVSIFYENEIYSIIPYIYVQVIYGYANVAAQGKISGDNYVIKDFNNGLFIAGISDGMGKGYRAFCDSCKTLKLVNEVININMPIEKSLNFLNSLYIYQDYYEHYATLDLVEINRFNSTVSFYKMGGSTTYLLHSDNTLEKITNSSLPFGIEEKVPKIVKSISDEDIILMSSDGIFENIEETEKLELYLKEIKKYNPQKIAYDLLEYAMKNKKKTNDDMSVIVLKVKTKDK